MIKKALIRRKPGRPAFLLLALAGLAGICYLGWHSLSSPSNGVIKNPSNSSTPNSLTKTSAKATSFDGKYISFNYPKGYTKAYSALSGNYLEVDRLYAERRSDRYISVGLVRESLVNDSGANFRQNHPEIYSRQTGPGGVLAFLKTSGSYERTFFIEHNDMVLSIAAVDSVGNDVSADQDQLLNSLKWK